MHQPVLLLTVLVVVQWTVTLGQLPLRIDVTWFEQHHEWQQADSAMRAADANSGVNNNKNDDEAASEPEQEETDRHTQQAWVEA
jgi:hypothetical protein